MYLSKLKCNYLTSSPLFKALHPVLANGPVQMSIAKSIGASVRTAVCRKHTTVSCLTVGCDWSDDGHPADVTVSHLDTV